MTDPAIEAAAAAMFESAHARTGTAPDSPQWTWEMATPDVKTYYRGLARIGSAAAYKAEAALLRTGDRPCRGCIYEWLEERAAALRGSDGA